MPSEAKPLFRADALRPKLVGFGLRPGIAEARKKLGNWADLLGNKQAETMKETELLPGFITDLFERLLGFAGPESGGDTYTLKREALIKVDGKQADAALGRFAIGGDAPRFIAVVEGKGPRDPLDRPFAGRALSAVDQALRYAVNLQCDWYLVTNLREIRLYHKGHDQFTYERFETPALVDNDLALRKLVYLLGAERLAPAKERCHLDDLMADSERIGLDLTRDYYREYSQLRRTMFNFLRLHNQEIAAPLLLGATQKILDRVLFIAFCEDRGLLPAKSIAQAYRHADPYNPRPIWHNFRGLFKAIGQGSPPLRIEQYNGGLFAHDDLLDRLQVPDEVCKGLDRLAAYEYRPPVLDDDMAAGTAPKFIDVEILGHIFEQSISDLEQLHQEIAKGPDAEPAKAGPSRRKKEGAFYTPAFITRYIVSATLKPVLEERFNALREAHRENAAGAVARVLENPSAYDVARLTAGQKKALELFWNEWQDALATLRIVDPACGSGAFLIEAFEQLHAVYQQANARLTELRGPQLFDVDRQILQSNLFGVDLNPEAVEICRLSLWIKTAQIGKVLTSLDRNVVQGNSVVADPAVHPKALNWQATFPEVFAAGGFDVVIANPPYVRQEWIKEYKPYLERRFPDVFSGTADLYVYFYALGFDLLRPGGKLAFISSSSFVRAGFAVFLRRFLTSRCRLEQFIDLGDTQTFSDAKDVYPAIVVASKPINGEAVQEGTVKSVRFRREDRGEEIRELISKRAIEVPSASLAAEGWRFEAKELIGLRTKLLKEASTLGNIVDGRFFRGLLSGLNEAFIISETRARQLLDLDNRYGNIIKPFAGGQDLRRWHHEDSGNWLIVMPSGFTSRSSGSCDEAAAWAWVGETYPAVVQHLSPFEAPARKRGDKGEFWWELRACDYYAEFDKPKIMYPDIAKSARFSIDTSGLYSANTTYIVPRDDYYLLGVLNSDTLWFALAGISIPFGERAGEFRYRLFTQYVQMLPIPDAQGPERFAVASLGERCTAIATQRHQLEEQVRRRLVQGFGFNDNRQSFGKLNDKAQDWWEQGLNSLGDALKQSFKLASNPFKNPATADQWQPYLEEKRGRFDKMSRELTEAEADINERVYRLFNLTKDEVKLLQREVDH